MIREASLSRAALVVCQVALLTSVLAAQESSPPGRRLAADWGEIHVTDRGLSLHVTENRLPAGGAIRIPRLHNPVAAVYLADDRASPLKLTPHVSEWEIEVPRERGRAGRLVVVVETSGPPHLAGKPPVIGPSRSGVITLAAHNAATHGQNLRYEPQPHKNTIGYWSRAEDWCTWQFVAPPGRYEVQILQGCGRGHGGSEVALAIGGQEILFTVEETGHFQNFKNRTVGTVDLAGNDQHTLTLRPRNKKAGAVMDVRQVRLLPVKRND